MNQPQNPNTSRKSEAQQAFEQAENIRRFAVNLADNRGLPGKPGESTSQDTSNLRQEREQHTNNSDPESTRDKAPSQD